MIRAIMGCSVATVLPAATSFVRRYQVRTYDTGVKWATAFFYMKVDPLEAAIFVPGIDVVLTDRGYVRRPDCWERDFKEAIIFGGREVQLIKKIDGERELLNVRTRVYPRNTDVIRVDMFECVKVNEIIVRNEKLKEINTLDQRLNERGALAREFLGLFWQYYSHPFSK